MKSSFSIQKVIWKIFIINLRNNYNIVENCATEYDINNIIYWNKSSWDSNQ